MSGLSVVSTAPVVNWIGTWVAGSYPVNTGVYYNGSAYVAQVVITAAYATPDTNPEWALINVAGPHDTSAYNPATSTAPAGSTQVQDISACVITLPVLMMLSVKDVEIYGQLAKSAEPLVICEQTLPKPTLMGVTTAGTDAAILFRQDPADADKVLVNVNEAFDDTETGAFATNFNTVLKDPVKLSSLDANAYLWWNEAGKGLSADPNWANKDSVLYRHGSFGKFVLSKIAYDVFGHPLAQAGIANDKAIEDDLFSTTSTVGSVGKRLAAAFKTLTSAQLQSVYEQLLAQDPSRFNLEDASGGAIGSAGSSAQALPRPLPFAVNDVIRFEVILDDYNVKRIPLNTLVGNTVTSESGTAIESDFTPQSANSGGVLSTRYAGLKVTVEMKIGESSVQMSPAKLAALNAWNQANNQATAAKLASSDAVIVLQTALDELDTITTEINSGTASASRMSMLFAMQTAAGDNVNAATAAVAAAEAAQLNAIAAAAAAEAAFNAIPA